LPYFTPKNITIDPTNHLIDSNGENIT